MLRRNNLNLSNIHQESQENNQSSKEYEQQSNIDNQQKILFQDKGLVQSPKVISFKKQQPSKGQSQNRNVMMAEIAKLALQTNYDRNSYRANYESYSYQTPVQNKKKQQTQQTIGTKKQVGNEKPKFSYNNQYISINQTHHQTQTEDIRYHILDQHLCVVNSRNILDESNQEDFTYECHLKGKHSGRKEQQQIYIGRSTTSNRNHIFIKNDLVSRNHCKIRRVKNDLKPLSSTFLAFIMCIQYVQDYHPLSKLSKNIIKTILRYAQSNHGYFILDQGSRNGTYIKIDHQYKQMKQDHLYSLAGQKYQMKVVRIFKIDIKSSENKIQSQSIENYNKQMLIRMQSRKNSKPKPIVIQNQQKNNQNKQKISMMEISIKSQGGQNLMTYLLVSTKNHINLGLNLCINLDDPAVPYHDKQSQIKYYKNRWWIKDGGIFISTFGTWRKLQVNQEYKLEKSNIIKLGSCVTLEYQYHDPNKYILYE